MVAKPENEPDAAISATVERLYDTYPFPPESLLDEAPLGYNWRWHYPSVHAFCTGGLAPPQPSSSSSLATEPLRILDAGCGTGESTTFLVYQNPGAQITAIDLSAGALDVARERLRRSLPSEQGRVNFHHMSIFDLEGDDDDTSNNVSGSSTTEIETNPAKLQYDYINCVGVIHHTPDPPRALRALAKRLKPGGLMHIFVYGAHGRWEISLMQEALSLLRKPGAATTDSSSSSSSNEQSKDASFEDGVRLGRRVFGALPDGNRLKERERDRWAQDNLKDATFADMYLHPQEIDYTVTSLFDQLVDASGLEFVGFSNPRTWDVSRLLSGSGSGDQSGDANSNNEDLVRMAQTLPNLRDRYRLVELLDPEAMTHFEFFLAKPYADTGADSAVGISNNNKCRAWRGGCVDMDDDQLRRATPSVSQCLFGWPSKVIMDRDYFPLQLSDEDFNFVKAVKDAQDGAAGSNEGSPSSSGDHAVSVGDAMEMSGADLQRVRQLVEQGVILLKPC